MRKNREKNREFTIWRFFRMKPFPAIKSYGKIALKR